MPNRIQQEVDELLAKLEASRPKPSLGQRLAGAIGDMFGGVGNSVRRVAWPRLSAGHVLLIAAAVIVVAYLWAPSASGSARWFIAGGIVVFILAFVVALRRPSGGGGRSPQKYWRDKPIDLREPSKFRSWWDRRNRR